MLGNSGTAGAIRTTDCGQNAVLALNGRGERILILRRQGRLEPTGETLCITEEAVSHEFTFSYLDDAVDQLVFVEKKL